MGTLPSYDFSLWFMTRWLLGVVVLQRRRNLGADARTLFAGRRPRPLVVGIEHVPVEGPCILVMNHYERSGLRVWWCASLVTAAVWERRGADPPVRWLITDRFHGFRFAEVRFPDGLIAWLLRAIARAYGLVLVARPEGEQGLRSAALREARRALREPESGVPAPALGITPEAATGSGPELAEPWPGSGVALAWLSAGRAPLVPVGVYDDETGRLVARFGRPFTLPWSNLREGRASERELASTVMRAISAQLPQQLHGPYGGAVD